MVSTMVKRLEILLFTPTRRILSSSALNLASREPSASTAWYSTWKLSGFRTGSADITLCAILASLWSLNGILTSLFYHFVSIKYVLFLPSLIGTCSSTRKELVDGGKPLLTMCGSMVPCCCVVVLVWMLLEDTF